MWENILSEIINYDDVSIDLINDWTVCYNSETEDSSLWSVDPGLRLNLFVQDSIFSPSFRLKFRSWSGSWSGSRSGSGSGFWSRFWSGSRSGSRSRSWSGSWSRFWSGSRSWSGA